MTPLRSLALITLTAAGLASPAQAQTQAQTGDTRPSLAAPRATTDPLLLIYRLPGISSSGIGNSGAATTMRCTNYSRDEESLRFVVDRADGTTVRDVTELIPPRATRSYSTTSTASIDEVVLNVPNLSGNMRLFATTTNLHCTAMLIDAAAAVPTGVALHLVRFNPREGTTE